MYISLSLYLQPSFFPFHARYFASSAAGAVLARFFFGLLSASAAMNASWPCSCTRLPLRNVVYFFWPSTVLQPCPFCTHFEAASDQRCSDGKMRADRTHVFVFPLQDVKVRHREASALGVLVPFLLRSRRLRVLLEDIQQPAPWLRCAGLFEPGNE